MGRWKKVRGLDDPAYFGQISPFYVGYKLLENGDYEAFIYTDNTNIPCELELFDKFGNLLGKLKIQGGKNVC